MSNEMQNLKEEIDQNKEQENILDQIKDDKRVEALKKYLKKNGLNLAFQAIFSEIVTKKVEKEQVFVYTAMRLRQIGNDLNSMQKKEAKV